MAHSQCSLTEQGQILGVPIVVLLHFLHLLQHLQQITHHQVAYQQTASRSQLQTRRLPTIGRELLVHQRKLHLGHEDGRPRHQATSHQTDSPKSQHNQIITRYHDDPRGSTCRISGYCSEISAGFNAGRARLNAEKNYPREELNSVQNYSQIRNPPITSLRWAVSCLRYYQTQVRLSLLSFDKSPCYYQRVRVTLGGGKGYFWRGYWVILRMGVFDSLCLLAESMKEEMISSSFACRVGLSLCVEAY